MNILSLHEPAAHAAIPAQLSVDRSRAAAITAAASGVGTARADVEEGQHIPPGIMDLR
jgi:hypothetical protein